jgi:integrase
VVLNPPQIQAYLENTPSQKYRTLFLLAITSGARQGELLGLKWSDLDMMNSQIHIQRTCQKGQFFITKTRTSNRHVDIGPTTMKALKSGNLPAIEGA